MRVRITKAIDKIADKAFKTMLSNGAFPKVRYAVTISQDGYRWEEYSLFDYCDAWGKFAKLLDKWIKQEGLDPVMGIYSRKHSADFLAKVEELANEITEADMLGQKEHFRTIADSIMESL